MLAQGLLVMQLFLLSSRGDASAPARSVEHPAASPASSILEQLADPFTFINALNVWLELQGHESGSPELRRLRSAVAVLAQKRNPKMRYIRHLCFDWGVQQTERRK